MPYLLFAGDTYYPSGGAEDYRGSFESLDEAAAYANRHTTGADSIMSTWDWCNCLYHGEDGTVRFYEFDRRARCFVPMQHPPRIEEH